jgi:hypothetical protein
LEIMSLTLKSGKFYDSNGNIVPLEFGNNEQFKVLKRVELMMSEGEELGLDFDTDSQQYGTFFWDCFCGDEIRVHNNRPLDGVKYTCKRCKAKYVLQDDDDQIGLLVKLRK